MSQTVGSVYRSRIPSFSDDASIVEALRVYHYGVDDFTTQPIPDDSIEGNFRTLTNDLATVSSTISGLTGTYVEQVSASATPNIITGQSISTTPITVKAIASQTAPLQQWQNSSSVSVGSIGVGGNTNIAGYLTVGSTTQSTTTGVNVVIGNAAHKGIVVKAQPSQTANIQEWQSNAGTAIAYVDNNGKIFSNQSETVNLVDVQTLTNKTLTSPTISTPTITGGTVSGATSITLSGEQTVGSFRVRNIFASISTPLSTDGVNGDIWVKYIA